VGLIVKLLRVDHEGRIRRLQHALGEHRLDGLLITHLPNLRYLCGFTGSAGSLLLTEAAIVLFTDGRYKEQAHAEVDASSRVVISKSNAVEAAASWLGKNHRKVSARKVCRLAIEGEHLAVAARRRLVRQLPVGVRLLEAPPLVERARMTKDADEIRLIRAAAKVGASLFQTARHAIENGKKESEVAAEMEYTARRADAEGMSFPTIVLGGKRSALPHGRASRNPIPHGGFVLCDFGVILAGYCSDRTRTLFRGRLTPAARHIYQAVLEAQQTGLAAVKPGATAGEVDRSVRKILKKHKLDRYFTHSTGHGVGLEIHEAPRLAAQQTEVLRPGMVITIEPGVYIPDKWGVRIEDMVLVTDKGHEVLAPGDKELITV
jgi:Xaa-Pro aminopeptidase